MAGPYEVLLTQRHPELKRKEENWKLIYNSYLGGTSFSEAGYLMKYPKESQKSFEIRKKRAVYFNQLSPVVDMLSGLLYLNEPTREIPKDFEYLTKNINGDKKINEFMRIVGAHSLMFTCGILVDMPNFDREQIKTMKDVKDSGIQPYATLYMPFRIRDFNIAADGAVDWVLLDNSYREHSDPFKPGKDITKYTLWTRTYYQDFERADIRGEITTSGAVPHDLGEVPFRFVAWRDDNNDFISESVCEDIAMVSKLIYNNLSYMDEMLAAGTFKMLAYPTADGDIPESLKSGGVGALSIIPYPIDSSTQPAFIGHSLTEIDPFIKAIEFYMAEVLKKVGLSTDETKEFVKSGAAKKIDFQKMRALLISGALMMGKTEEWIFKTAAKWQGKTEPSVRCDYTASFSDEDLRTEVTMLTELLVLPIKKLRTEVSKLLVKKLLANNLEATTIDEINREIESGITADPMQGKSTSNIDVNAAAKKIRATDPKQNTEPTEQGAK